MKRDKGHILPCFDGGRTQARTVDPLIKSQLLYQLSYTPIKTEERLLGSATAGNDEGHLAKACPPV